MGSPHSLVIASDTPSSGESQVWGPLAGGVKKAFCSVSQLPGEGHLCASHLGKLVSGGGCEGRADLEGTWKGNCVSQDAGWKESTSLGLVG